MGTVYRVLDKQINRVVALKLLHRHDQLAVARALREARAQARVTHEHVCKIYEVGIEEASPYIVMEYVEGQPLSSLTDQLTVEEKAKVIGEAAAALHEAHRLGLVHRDVKPSNILAARGDDGRWKPYVMDFGLAREAGEQRLTGTGEITGTPAYMAPEQARGEAGQLDRRTDVYSLGATLYHLLAGHPPFKDEHVAQVLMRLMSEDVPPLRAACPAVPEDLEKIVMKCLERVPQQRYESARALAEDLRRYLDGEPVQARRASLRYVLAKRARKHRLALSLAGVALVASMVLLGFWLRARRLAAEEARLSLELGENVKEMQLFIRYATALPLHDMGREREVVRRRLVDIERRMNEAGRAGEGPGHFALGAGFLALQEPEEAASHLRRASAAGYASPDLSYALGLSLVELYKRAREELPRMVDPRKREARQRELDAEYREPALAHLRAAQGTVIESPAYVQGLIHFYSGRPEEALASAKEAFEKAPWLYEAKRLEADAHAALGDRYSIDGSFDWDRMMAHLGPAAEAYRAAAGMAESDPDVHLGACALWLRIARGTEARGEKSLASLANVDEACGKALAANPGDGRALVLRARAHATHAFNVASVQTPSDDPRGHIAEAIRIGEEAVRKAPSDPWAQASLGEALEAEMVFAGFSGRDGEASLQRARSALEAALRIDPRFSVAQMRLAQVGFWHIIFEARRGRDVSPAMESALQVAEDLSAREPGFSLARMCLGLIHFHTAEALAERGQSPHEQVKQALAMAEEMARLNPGWFGTYHLKFMCQWLLAVHEISAGRDPQPFLEQAKQSLEMSRQRNAWVIAHKVEGHLRYAEALRALELGQDPGPKLAGARDMLRRDLERAPWYLELRVSLARVEILSLRRSMTRNEASPAMFEAALALLLPADSGDIAYPDFHQAVAEIYALRAAWLLERGGDPDPDIEKGLAVAARALAWNPHAALAHATEGALHLLSARRAGTGSARRAAAGRAVGTLMAAFRDNPLLERQHGAELAEARRLLGEGPGLERHHQEAAPAE
jgi:serine/threonine-protein kinase